MKAVIDRFASSPKGEGDLPVLGPRSPVFLTSPSPAPAVPPKPKKSLGSPWISSPVAKHPRRGTNPATSN
jgi:hypothetical protein